MTLSESIPTIETPRLRLRPFAPADVSAYAEFCASATVMQYVGDGQPLSADDAWRQVAFFLGHWQLRGYGQWAVELRATGKLLGRAGLHHPHGWPGLEVGWLLNQADWGNGYATEAGRAALEFARDALRVDRVISVIHHDNAASIRVAERLGGEFEKNASIRDKPVAIYRIDIPPT